MSGLSGVPNWAFPWPSLLPGGGEEPERRPLWSANLRKSPADDHAVGRGKLLVRRRDGRVLRRLGALGGGRMSSSPRLGKSSPPGGVYWQIPESKLAWSPKTAEEPP